MRRRARSTGSEREDERTVEPSLAIPISFGLRSILSRPVASHSVGLSGGLGTLYEIVWDIDKAGDEVRGGRPACTRQVGHLRNDRGIGNGERTTLEIGTTLIFGQFVAERAFPLRAAVQVGCFGQQVGAHRIRDELEYDHQCDLGHDVDHGGILVGAEIKHGGHQKPCDAQCDTLARCMDAVIEVRESPQSHRPQGHEK